jgi:hypothetical protein
MQCGTSLSRYAEGQPAQINGIAMLFIPDAGRMKYGAGDLLP